MAEKQTKAIADALHAKRQKLTYQRLPDVSVSDFVGSPAQRGTKTQATAANLLASMQQRVVGLRATWNGQAKSVTRCKRPKQLMLGKQDSLLFVRKAEKRKKGQDLEKRIQKQLEKLKRMDSESTDSQKLSVESGKDEVSDDSEIDLHFQIAEKRYVKLYDVQDIQKELEELTEDEQDYQRASDAAREHINIKRQIKMTFKRNLCAPTTTEFFYRIGRILGKGAFGKVNLAIQKLSRKICAVKSINKLYIMSQNDQLRVLNERFMLQTARLRHPNIVQMFEYVETDNYHLFFMELCTGGDLLHYVRRRRKLDEQMASHFFRKIMQGIAYLHARDIVHRDIKLENILISNMGEVKICDFGVSFFMGAERQMFDCCGTPAYMAPEVVVVGNYLQAKAKQERLEQRRKELMKDQKKRKKPQPEEEKVEETPPSYNQTCDIWSAGVVLYAMLYG